MFSQIAKDQIKLCHSCLFGKTESDSKVHNMGTIVGKDILNYRITQIKCQIKSNEGIFGIQLKYKNLITEEQKILINIISKEPNLIEQEITLNYEQISDVKFWENDDNKLIGFEICTNSGRFQKFGYGKDEQLKYCHEIKNKERVVVGFNIIESEKNGIIAMSLYHMDKRTYGFYIYKEIFMLRSKVRNDKNKNEMGKKTDKMNDIKKKILFKICALPDNQFFNIIKFTLS